MTVSRPRYWMLVGWAVSLLVCIGLIAAVPVTAFRLVVAAIFLVNALQLPRAVWGFEISDAGLRVWYPLWPLGNRLVTRQEIAAADVNAQPIRLFSYTDTVRLRLVDGKTLRLGRVGTTSFDDLVHFLRGAPA
jgi:uncharacterized membrane protein YccF (DUF307 family)